MLKAGNEVEMRGELKSGGALGEGSQKWEELKVEVDLKLVNSRKSEIIKLKKENTRKLC